MPSGWQTGIAVAPNNLAGVLVTAMTPAYLRQVYLVGVNLGAAWDCAAGDAAMQGILNGLIGETQSRLGIRFERTVVKTDPDPALVLGTDYDELGERLQYFPPGAGQGYFYIPLPQSHVVSIEQVRLFARDTVIAVLPTEWVRFTSKEGLLRIMPDYAPGGFVGSLGLQEGWYLSIGYWDSVPDAWAVDYTMGHGQIDADVARYIGLMAARQVLALATVGADISGGLASESLTMDGITESITYVTGKYGPYSGAIQALTDELEKFDFASLRLRKKGLKVAVW